MQPLDIDRIDTATMTAVNNHDKKAIAGVMTEIVNRIQHAINPISNISAPLVIYVLKASTKAISDQFPGADKMADIYGQLVGFASIKVPVPQKDHPPEP